MEWSDEGVVLSSRPHGETAAIAELFTRHHGRALGLVYGGRSRRLRPVLQSGNHVDATWKARLAEQLGHLTLSLRRGYAAEAMDDPAALAGVASLCWLARLLPERDPHPALYEVTLFVLDYLDDRTIWPALLVRWELALLDELGMGLDLSACAATGVKEDLIFVSPKSGRAVSAAAGAPYRDKLLALPQFLVKGRDAPIAAGDIVAGLKLTGYFLTERVLVPRDLCLPEVRDRLVETLAKAPLSS